MKIMVTGGLGFIGTEFVRLLLDETDHFVVIVDKQTYAANEYWWEGKNQGPYEGRMRLYIDDIVNANTHDWPVVDAIIHFAAETHVDNSIGKASPFIHTNVNGTHKLLEYAREVGVEKFLFVSTDEVYGCTPVSSQKCFSEKDQLNPRNPYSATKAAGELLCEAYRNTYDVPILITRSCNNYGPFQHDEKLIPTVVRSLAEGKPIPVYGRGANVREWIPVEENCRGILEVFERGRVGDIYNIGSGWRLPNLELVIRIIDFFGEGSLTFVKDRLGHDLRYALDSSKIAADLDWYASSPHKMWDKFEDTLLWYGGRYHYETALKLAEKKANSTPTQMHLL